MLFRSHITPYISTTWNHISSLKTLSQKELFELVITLQDATTLHIPNLSPSDVAVIFAAHAEYLEGHDTHTSSSLFITKRSLLSFTELKQLICLLHHDAQQSHSPDFPAELEQRIVSLGASLPNKDTSLLPEEEAHCNCPHCQTVRLMRRGMEQDVLVEEQDLRFDTWIIKQINAHEYLLQHPDHEQEKYTVSLNSPLYCSCGSKSCEHILAVLKS